MPRIQTWVVDLHLACTQTKWEACLRIVLLALEDIVLMAVWNMAMVEWDMEEWEDMGVTQWGLLLKGHHMEWRTQVILEEEAME